MTFAAPADNTLAATAVEDCGRLEERLRRECEERHTRECRGPRERQPM
jgi:hypothetical protein